MKSFRSLFAIVLSLACGAALLPGSATATEGYFQYGYGARQKALGGAGVADSRDATAAALNPAGLVNVEDQLNASVSVFRVFRGFDGSGQPGFTPNGAIGSDRPYFGIPNLAWSQRLSSNPFADVMALTVYVNGGLNTEYRASAASLACQALSGTGVFCGGGAGADLKQAFLSAAFAKQFGSVSVGIAPILAVQSIDFDGLQLFQLLSASPANVTDHGYDWSYGGGVRAGIEIKATDNIRLGIAGNSRIWMSDFDSYRGLLADGGDFDIPPTLQAGIAVDVNPRLTLMLDYKRIWYSVIKSINNPSTNLLTASDNPANKLGASNGPGFGWQDIDIIKFGAEWRATQKLTLRTGYAYNEGTFSSRDVEVNILAPGIVRHHFTGGLSYELSREWDFELAGYYSPQEKVAGPELGIPTGLDPPLDTIGNPNHIIEIQGQGGEVTFGLTYRFGATVPTLK